MLFFNLSNNFSTFFKSFLVVFQILMDPIDYKWGWKYWVSLIDLLNNFIFPIIDPIKKQ